MRRPVGPYACGLMGQWSSRYRPPLLHITRRCRPLIAVADGWRHEQIWALRRQGWTGQAIAQQLRIGKSTVFRYLRSSTFAERTYKRRGYSVLNPYKDTILQHWNQGCHDALQLFHRLQQQGYQGSYATVARYAQRLGRRRAGTPPPASTAHPLPVVAEPQHGHLTPRGTAWLVLRRPETRVPDEEQQLAQLTAQQPDLAEAVTLVGLCGPGAHPAT